jgi:hypothetical protein
MGLKRMVGLAGGHVNHGGLTEGSRRPEFIGLAAGPDRFAESSVYMEREANTP